MRFVLEQTPAETTAYRFARLDLKHFSPLPGRYVRGDLAKGEIYYTNSTHLHPAAPVDPLTRVRMEGLFHPFFRAGAVTHVELGAAEPPASALAGFLVRAFRETTEQSDRLFSRIHLLRRLRRHLPGTPASNARIAGPKRWTAWPGSPSISAGYRAGTGGSGPNSATGTATKTISPSETAPIRTEPREFNQPASLDRVRIDSYISANFGA